MAEGRTLFLGVDASGAQAGARVFQDAMNAAAGASGRVQASTTSLDRSLARLTAQLDPAAAATAKLERGTRTLDTALARGRISLAQHGNLLSKLQERYRETAVAQGRFADVLKSFGGGLLAGAGLGGALGVSELARGFISAADAANRLDAQLRVATGSSEAATAAFSDLYAIAARTGTPVEALAQLYARVSGAGRDLGASQEDLMRLTEAVANALKVGGQSAESASGALLQLGQALGSPKIQAEEFNSLLDGMRPLLQVVANNVDAAGGSVGRLTALVKDGQVSNREFFQAAIAGGRELAEQGEAMGTSWSGAITRMRDATTRLVGALDDTSGATDTMKSAMGGVADVIDRATDAVKGLGDGIGRDLIGQLTLLNSPGGPLLSVWNSIEALTQKWRAARMEMGGATGSWQFGAEGSWEVPAAPAPARPALPAPAPAKTAPRASGSSRSPGRSDAERDYDAAKRGYDSYLKDQMREERQALADLARGERELVSLRIEAAEATGLHARALELRRQAALKAIRDEALSETELQEAIKLTNSIYDARLAEMKDNGATLNSSLSKTVELTDDLGRGFEFFGQTAASSFADAILQGEKLSDTLAALGNDLARMTAGMLMQRAIGGALSAGGNWLSGLFSGGGFSFEGGTVGGFSTSGSAAGESGFFGMGEFRQGGAFDRGEVLPFAKGGVIDRPVLFPLARGAGLMGEAGPEAIMPLARLPGGNLGVRAAGAPAVNFTSTVVNNVPGVEVQREERQNASGGMDVTFTIDRAMADLLTRRGSASNRALRRGGDERGPVR